MIYRVVQRHDGLYQTQYRSMYLWWCNSCHEATADLKEQIDFAELATSPRHKRSSKIKRVVWTPRRGHKIA